MPSLSSIDGLGEKAAEAIMEAAKDGPYLSRDDLRQRTKVSKTVIELMGELNLLGDIPNTNQISLFDFAENSSEIIEKIKRQNVDNMTAREALNFLWELKDSL